MQMISLKGLFKLLVMFESSRAPPSKSSQRVPSGLYQQHTLTSIKDSLSSITYRISEIETSMNRKIDRSQCMGILDKKVNIGHLKSYLEELQDKIKDDHKQEEERNNKIQEISIEKINHLSHKIKSINERVTKHESKQTSKNKSANKEKQRVIKPQQLYLETNETMFSLIIDEISKLQEKNTDIQKQLENRNKKIINLNNQVCKKIQKLENEIEQKYQMHQLRIHSKALNSEPAQGKYFGSSWSQMDRHNKPTVHKGSQMEGSTFQSIRFELITRNIEALQKQMLTKMNIKDILPIIRQNTQSFTDSNQELREYVEESVDSMRKILSSQTQINRQLSLGIRCGWWHSFTQQNDIAVINKQLVNLVPQIFELASTKSYSNFINIAQQGIYMIKIYPLVQISNFLSDASNLSQHVQDEYQIMIGTEVHVMGSESVLRLEKNTEIRVILRNHAQIVIQMQKL